MAKFCMKCGAAFSAEPICVKCGADIRNLAESAEHQSPTPSAHVQPPQNAPMPSAQQSGMGLPGWNQSL